jgi:uncharacterized protein
MLSASRASAPGLTARDRLIAMGRNTQGRPMFVAFTIRIKEGRLLIRPITARYMHAKEVKAYEAQGSEIQE